MATSVTELILRFRGDDKDLKSTMARVRAELSQTAGVQETTNKSELQRSSAIIAQWKQQEKAAAQEAAARTRAATQTAQAIEQEEKRLAATMIREAKAAQAARLQAESGRTRTAAQNAKAIEQEEKQLSAAMIREARAVQAARIQAESGRVKTAAQNARAIEQEEKRLAATMIREARTAQNARLQGERQAAQTSASLQRQRSAAFIADFKQQELAVARAITGMRPFSENIQRIADSMNVFVGQRIPLVGGAFIRVTENLRGFGNQSQKSTEQIKQLATSIVSIAATSGKTSAEVTSFLTKFALIETAAKRNSAAVEFFGATTARRLIPELEKAGAELSTITAESTAAGGALSGLAGPIAIAVIAAAALTAAVVLTSKAILSLAKDSVRVDAQMFDLSQQLGISTELLSALRVETKLVGGDITTITASLGIFQKKLEESEDGTSKTAQRFKELGISTADTETALRGTFAALSKLPEGYKQTAIALDLFGRGGKTVLAVLKSTNGDIDASITKLRALGLITSGPAAAGADKFADSLDLLDFQLDALKRNIEHAFVPAAIALVRGFSDFARDNQTVFAELSSTIKEVAGLIGGTLSTSIKGLGDLWRAQKPVVGFLDEVENKLTEINKVMDAINEATSFDTIFKGVPQVSPDLIPALPGEGPQPTPLPSTDNTQERVRLVRAEVEEAVRFAAEQVDSIERQVKEKTVAPLAALETVIATEKEKTRAVVEGLQSQRDARAAESALDEATRAKQLTDLEAFDKKIRDAEDQFRKLEADKRSDFRVKQLADEQEHRRKMTDVFVKGIQDQIAALNRSVTAGRVDPLVAADTTQDLLSKIFQRRKELLERERSDAGADVALRRKANDELTALEQERSAVMRTEADRRVDIARDEAQKTIDIQLANVDAMLKVATIKDSARMAALRSLAASRILTEEDTEKRILAIRLAAIDHEKDAINAKLTASKVVVDPQQRAKAEAELNNQLKILTAERTAIESQGERDRENGRQKDLDNEDRYANELISIRRRINDIQREASQAVIGLMIISHARRRDVLRAEADLAIKDENDRHEQVKGSIAAQRLESAESNRTQEEKNKKTEELNKLEEVEAERHRLVMQGIASQSKQDEAAESPIGQAIDSLRTGRIPELPQGIQEWADVAIAAFGTVSAAVGQLAQGVGELVGQWVLMGTTGPNAFRKLAASILASVAQQAAVLAIMSLAYAALATTVVGAILLGGTPAQFLMAAALFGAVAVGTALVGRAIAENSFSNTNEEAKGPQSAPTPEPERRRVEGRTAGGFFNPAMAQEANVVVRLVLDSAVLEEKTVKIFRRNGSLRSVLRGDLLGEAAG